MNQELKIGWASADFSTERPVLIHGQFPTRVSKGIMDPLTMTALVVDNGEDSLVFLSLDATIIPPSLVVELRKQLRIRRPELPAEKLVVNATHTHTTGDLRFWPLDDFPLENYPEVLNGYMTAEEFQSQFMTKALEAIERAWDSRRKGGVAWGTGYAVTGYSRKVWYFDDLSKRPGAQNSSGVCINGHAAMYGNTNDPMFSHFEAGADSAVNLLYTFDEKDHLTGAIINVACPSQVTEGLSVLSADFWHETRNNIHAEYGNIFILPQCAPAGDLSPHPLHNKKALERRRQLKGVSERQDIANRISAAFEEVLSWAKKDIRRALPLKNRVERLELPRRKITKEEYEAEKELLAELEASPLAVTGTPLERFHHDSARYRKIQRSRGILTRYENDADNPLYVTELHAARLGDIAFVTNPFELYMDYMHRIQARSPFELTFNIQLVGNGYAPNHPGYLPTERGAEGKGYSASRYCNTVGPEGGQVLVEKTLSLLNELI